MQKIRVLLVDDHTIVRDGISALLALAGDIEVVGEATNGNEALKMVEELRPDVVLMDIAMPIMGGLEATRRISKEFPDSKYSSSRSMTTRNTSSRLSSRAPRVLSAKPGHHRSLPSASGRCITAIPSFRLP